MHTDGPAQDLARELEPLGVGAARVALVLGSGLGLFAERIEGARAVPYDEIPGMPHSAVPGHAGRLLVGRVAGVPVVAQQGRAHLYEGWSVEEVTRAARALAWLGVPALVLTNAAGGLQAEWKPPVLMRVTDHLNLQATRPPHFAFETESDAVFNSDLRRLQPSVASDRKGRRSGSPYDEVLGRAIQLAAREVGVLLYHGIYAGLLGPSYETPAEIRMLRWAGADAVGMSTVAEATAAHAHGMRVAALSCITNPAAGIAAGPLSHDEVVAAGARSAADFSRLLEAALPHLDAALGG